MRGQPWTLKGNDFLTPDSYHVQRMSNKRRSWAEPDSNTFLRSRLRDILRVIRKSRCQVCNHDERWRIELLRAGGASLDALATKFGIGRDAVHRHWRDHVPPELKAGYLAGPVQLQQLAQKAADAGGSVIDHLHAVRVILMGHLAAVTEAGDARGAALVGGRLTTTLEAIARVSGELGDLSRTTLNISNVTNVAILSEHPAFLRLQATLLRALAPFPEARGAAIAALRALDAQSAPAALEGPSKSYPSRPHVPA